MKYIHTTLVIFGLCLLFISCSTSGPSGLFGKKTPHQQYGDKLKAAGLNGTAMGRQWFTAAENSLLKPLKVSLPYSEKGYFAAGNPTAAGIVFSARRGQKLNIGLQKNPTTGFAVFLDLWRPEADNRTPKFLASADTTGANIEYEVEKDGDYQLRVQPELLKSGDYTVTVTTGPSLAFPVSAKAKTNIGSFWGAGRDNGQRSHEGIDIFAPKRTPLVAAAKGTVTRVNENNLGGKVVFMRPSGKNYTLYYAHLDEQIAQPGQSVKVGDTIGLVGNTGNARTTAPHLHFGIYTNQGAIDPLPFVDPKVETPSKITTSASLFNKWARTSASANLRAAPSGSSSTIAKLNKNTVLFVEAATAGWYRITTPDDKTGFVDANNIEPLKKLKTSKLTVAMSLLDKPDANAPVITSLHAGETVTILGSYEQYTYINKGDEVNGWVRL